MEKKKQLEFLNTLRFISVIIIVFTHFNYQCFSLYYTDNILEHFCYHNNVWTYWLFEGITGKYAVAMMCIISGWLVAKKFYTKPVDFGKFIFNRYFRLMIPIFFTSTIFVLIRAFQENYIPISTYLNSVFWLGNNGINEHLGYILDFFIGNVLIALITYLFSKKKYLPLLYIPIIFLLYYMDRLWILSTFVGGLTYHLCEIIKSKNLYRKWYLIMLIPLLWWLSRGTESNIVYLKYTISCSIIVITLYCIPKLQNIFNCNKIKDIKKISYSIFVTHGLVNILFGGYIVESFKKLNLINNIYVSQLILFIIILIIDLLISYAVYYISEYKLYNFINNFLSKRVNNYKIELIKEKGEEDEK